VRFNSRRYESLVLLFGALPGTLFIYFVIFYLCTVLIDTIFILGDGLTRLLLRWYLLLLCWEKICTVSFLTL
jgi:hypothetical protein